MTIGNDINFAKELSRFKNLHVRVSIKGCNSSEYQKLTNATKESYELPYKALNNLIQTRYRVMLAYLHLLARNKQ